MALKALLASDVPYLDNPAIAIAAPPAPASTAISNGVSRTRLQSCWRPCARFVAVGHRGSGMNKAVSPQKRMQEMMENTILSFNTASKRGVSFIEFDVQVTKDGRAVVFHDDVIITKDNDSVVEKRIDELTLAEFLSYGFQNQRLQVGKPLFRKSKDGRIHEWSVSVDDSLCSLRDAFEKVDRSLGFNIELKFDDEFRYPEELLRYKLQVILDEVYQSANGRQLFFSSFHPDAALMFRKMQSCYPVLFLTNGGTETYTDPRRNSLEAALELCLAGELNGIVSEIKGILRNPAFISKVKDSNLCLLTYGHLNNTPEIVYLQYLLGIEGVIVDLVEDIAASIAGYVGSDGGKMKSTDASEAGDVEISPSSDLSQNLFPPSFSTRELSFILKLIPQLIQS